MKKLLLIALSLVIFCACSKEIKSDSDGDSGSLVITSESSVGIRALQGGSATGKIVLQNSSSGLLKNLHLTPFNAPANVALTQGDCGNSLRANKSCYYYVNYHPDMNGNKQNTEQLVTFLATAENGHSTYKDSYTMVMQSFAKQDPLLLQTINFSPSSEAAGPSEADKIISLKKGHIDLLYTLGTETSNRLLNSEIPYPVLLRSTDALHWSVVGENWQDLKPSIQYVRALLAVNSNNDLLITYNSYAATAHYDGTQWHASPIKNWETNPAIKALLDSKPSIPFTSLLIPKDGLYIGFYDASPNELCPFKDSICIGNTIGILKFNGVHWELTADSWCYGSINQLRQLNGILYAATNTGVIKFDGKKWSRLGKMDFMRGHDDGSMLVAKVMDLVQTSKGDLYALIHHHGVVKYDAKADIWRSIGPEIMPGDEPGYQSLALFNDTLYVIDGSDWISQYNLKNHQWEGKYNPRTNESDKIKNFTPHDDDLRNYREMFTDDQGNINNKLLSVPNKFLYAIVWYDLFRYDGNRWAKVN